MGQVRCVTGQVRCVMGQVRCVTGQVRCVMGQVRCVTGQVRCVVMCEIPDQRRCVMIGDLGETSDDRSSLAAFRPDKSLLQSNPLDLHGWVCQGSHYATDIYGHL
jgi:hypothetical protein